MQVVPETGELPNFDAALAAARDAAGMSVTLGCSRTRKSYTRFYGRMTKVPRMPAGG